MASILLGWELGGGLGHVQTLVPIARSFLALGHRVHLVLKNVVEGYPLYRELSCQVFQAPFWHPQPLPGGKPFLASSYADILAIRGFADVDQLSAMLCVWDTLLAQTQPDLVIADHSPTLCLAARERCPIVVLGNGFTLPPTVQGSFPNLVPQQGPLLPQEHLLATINAVQTRRQRAPLPSLAALLELQGEFVSTLPELDPYRAVRQRPTCRLQPPLQRRPRPSRPEYFAYLGSDIGALQPLLAALALSGIPGRAYVRGANAALREQLRQPGLNILAEPISPAEALRTATVVVHHASLGTAHDALFAGCSQLLIPLHLEQQLTGRALIELGVAKQASQGESANWFTQTLRQLCTNEIVLQRSEELARQLEERAVSLALDQLIEHCLSLLPR